VYIPQPFVETSLFVETLTLRLTNNLGHVFQLGEHGLKSHPNGPWKETLYSKESLKTTSQQKKLKTAF
jgi:hypothetical protein